MNYGLHFQQKQIKRAFKYSVILFPGPYNQPPTVFKFKQVFKYASMQDASMHKELKVKLTKKSFCNSVNQASNTKTSRTKVV